MSECEVCSEIIKGNIYMVRERVQNMGTPWGNNTQEIYL